MFYAPWCEHCKEMKKAWDTLAAEYEGHADVLIADVDCIGAGEPLCKSMGNGCTKLMNRSSRESIGRS